jgi:hypothetical protein
MEVMSKQQSINWAQEERTVEESQVELEQAEERLGRVMPELEAEEQKLEKNINDLEGAEPHPVVNEPYARIQLPPAPWGLPAEEGHLTPKDMKPYQVECLLLL